MRWYSLGEAERNVLHGGTLINAISDEKDKIADIITTPENPLKNIHTMESVSYMMKAGIISNRISWGTGNYPVCIYS